MLDKKKIERLLLYDTPFYCYDLSLFRKTLDSYVRELRKYNYHAHYAFKANANPEILSIIKEYGLGADCVSGNEVLLALKMGFDPKKIVFAGVGKSDKEIEAAIEGDIFSFNCESIQEIEVIDQIAGEKKKKASIALRINPDIDAHTHRYISTGRSQDKFGISPWMFESVIKTIERCKNVELIGLHFHVGSQITEVKVFELLSDRVNNISGWFRERGVNIRSLNLGGGFGIDYTSPDMNPIPDFKSYFAAINKRLKVEKDQQIHFEPGRAVVAQCGILISKVLFVKHGRGKKFVIIDAGMTDLIRPALYQAHHKIENLTSSGRVMRYDVVGPVCESSDRFDKNVLLPETSRGDLIAIRSAGAYGQVMAMRYNQRDLAKEYCF